MGSLGLAGLAGSGLWGLASCSASDEPVLLRLPSLLVEALRGGRGRPDGDLLICIAGTLLLGGAGSVGSTWISSGSAGAGVGADGLGERRSGDEDVWGGEDRRLGMLGPPLLLFARLRLSLSMIMEAGDAKAVGSCGMLLLLPGSGATMFLLRKLFERGIEDPSPVPLPVELPPSPAGTMLLERETLKLLARCGVSPVLVGSAMADMAALHERMLLSLAVSPASTLPKRDGREGKAYVRDVGVGDVLF